MNIFNYKSLPAVLPYPPALCNHDPVFHISAELSAVIKATESPPRWGGEREVCVSSPPGIIPLYSSFKKQRIPHARFPRESRVREHASFSPLPSCFYGQGSLWNCVAQGHLCPASIYSACIFAGNVWFPAQCPFGKRGSWNFNLWVMQSLRCICVKTQMRSWRLCIPSFILQKSTEF